MSQKPTTRSQAKIIEKQMRLLFKNIEPNEEQRKQNEQEKLWPEGKKEQRKIMEEMKNKYKNKK